MILQCIPKEKFTKGFIEFSNDAFKDVELLFAVYGEKEEDGYEPSLEKNVITFGSPADMLESAQFKVFAESAKGIIVNWVNYRLVNGLKSWKDKVWLLFWGGDLYPYLRYDFRSPRQCIRRAILIRALRSYKGVISISEADKRRLVSLGARADAILEGAICGITREEAIRGSRKVDLILRAPKPSNPYRVVLGNSATRTNRHREAIRALSKFRQENLEVYVPLSYGDTSYALEVAEYGKANLGDRFIPLFSYMSQAEYKELLATMSVGIFNNDRQQAMGNISLLMRYGAKVYIARDNPVRDEYLSMGASLHYVDEIKHADFGEFIHYEYESQQSNSRIWSPIETHKRAETKWTDIYQKIISFSKSR